MTLITGGWSREDILAAIRPYDIKDKVHLIAPEQHAMLAFFSELGVEKVTDPEFKWRNLDLFPDTVTVNGTINNAATTLVLTDSTALRVGDVLFDPTTLERFPVTVQAGGGTDVTISRAKTSGQVAADTITSGEVLYIIGNALEEGNSGRDPISVQETTLTNYTQMVETSFEITGTEERSTDRGEKKMQELRRVELINHKSKLERIIIFGEKTTATVTKIKRNTNGLLKQITTNVFNHGAGVPSQDDFEGYLQDAFKYGSGDKVLICPPNWITVINSWARADLHVSNLLSKYGVKVMDYVSAHGNISLVRSHSLAGTIFSKYAVLLDKAFVKLVALGSNSMYWIRPDVQVKKKDARQDQYYSEFGVRVDMEQSCAVFKYT
jgi:hypothetical protein